MDPLVQRRRLIISLTVTVVAAIVAMGSVLGAILLHAPALNLLFGAALLAGFGSQIWVLYGFWRARDKP